MENDSLLPDEELERLRNDVNILKRKQGLVPTEDSDMKTTMVALSRSINSLVRIFKEASEDLKMDTHDAVLVAQKLDRIVERLDRVEAQNEKIAKGIVAIADMVETLGAQKSPLKSQGPQPSPPPQARPLPQYNMPHEDKKKNFMNIKF